MADSTRVDELTDALLAHPPGSPSRARISGTLIAYLRDQGDLKNWTKKYWSTRYENAHDADDYVSEETIELTRYLNNVDDMPADGRVKILYTVATRAVVRLIDTNMDTGFSGVSIVRSRARIFQDKEAQARTEGVEQPDAVAIIEEHNASLTPAQIQGGERLHIDELDLYRSGGNLRAGSFEGYDHVGADQYKEFDDRDEAAEQLAVVLDQTITRIMRDYKRDCGLVWYSIVLSRYLAFFPDVEADEVAAEAGFGIEVARRYHDIVMSNEELRALVESGATPQSIIQPAIDASPDDAGALTYARQLLRTVSRIAPAEMELATFAISWLSVSADLGRRPRLTEVVEDADERFGASTLNTGKTKDYQRKIAAILRDVIAASVRPSLA